MKSPTRSTHLRNFSPALVLAVCLLVATPALAAVINWVSTERVSVSTAGVQGNDDSGRIDYVDVSEDGRYVVFLSDANNLAAPDSDGDRDIFVRDRVADTTELISVNLAGTDSGDGSSYSPSISSDGRYVAFESGSTDLVATDSNTYNDCFVRDRVSGTTQLASLNSAGTDSANESSSECRISGNGRYVLFASNATDLVATDTNGSDPDLFLRDLVSGTTEIVSLDENGGQASGLDGSFQDVSDDGRFIMFESDGLVVSPNTYSGNEVYVRDRVAGTTERMSVDSSGAEYNDSLDDAQMSGDGRYFTWYSSEPYVTPDTNSTVDDVFVHDRITGVTSVVSVDSSGTQGNGDSGPASFSTYGRYIAFTSTASDLVSGDSNGDADVFVHDMQTGETTRVSLAYDGSQSDTNSTAYNNIAIISGDGSVVAFATNANDIVASDTGGHIDVFAVELDLPLDTGGGTSSSTTNSGSTLSKGIAASGTTTLQSGRILVSVPSNAIPSGENNCRISITRKGNSGDYGFSLDDTVWDVSIVCSGAEQHVLFAPISVCIRPKDGDTSDKQVFHKHGGGAFTALASTGQKDGYVCGQTQTLSLFTLGSVAVPNTGFAPGVVTVLPEQPASAAYTTSDLTLSIPELGLDMDIVGVPQGPNGWDVSWLGPDAGYLYGTAFPTMAGNTVLTAHVWNADNTPGPFAHLDELRYGDRFSITAWGSTYTYEVRGTSLYSPNSLRPLRHEDYDWVTLLTCADFNEASGQYTYRRAVRAVLVSVD